MLISTTGMSINKEWHRMHPMVKNATIEQRIKWHLGHLKHCNCRTDLREKIKEELRKRNIKY